MGLKIISSSDFNSLISYFKQNIKKQKKVFSKESIVVENHSLAQILKLTIAIEESVSLNHSFFLPSSFWDFLKSLLQEFLIDAGNPVGNNDFFEKDISDKSYLKWFLLKELKTRFKYYPELAEFLEENNSFSNSFSESKANKNLYQFATHLANIFDEYFYYYFDFEELLLKVKEKKINAHDFSAYYGWQIRLLKNILSTEDTNGKVDGAIYSKKKHLELLKENILQLQNRDAFPKRLYFFLTPPISLFNTELLNTLSETDIEIYLFLYSFELPSSSDFDFNAELVNILNNEQKNLKEKLKNIEKIISIPSISSFVGFSKTNISDNLKRISSDFQMSEISEKENKKSSLKIIQNCFLKFQNSFPQETLSEDIKELKKKDNLSEVINVHHSVDVLSELENVRDFILSLLKQKNEKDVSQSFFLEDIIIASPCLDNYEPYLSYVFSNIFTKNPSSQNEKNQKTKQAIFYQKEKNILGLVECIKKILLCLEGEAFASKSILELLNFQEICDTFDLDDDDLEIIYHWLDNCNFTNQLNNNHLLHWEKAVDNALVSYALLPSSENYFSNYIVPIFKTNKGLTNSREKYNSLVKFFKLLDSLKKIKKQYYSQHSLLEWKNILEWIVNFFLSHHPEKLSLQKIILILKDEFQTSNYQEKISLQEILDWLEEKSHYFKKQEYNIGGLRIGSLESLRGVPAKGVCLIGMQQSYFPDAKYSSSFSFFNLSQFNINLKNREQQKSLLLLWQFFFSAESFFYISSHQNSNHHQNDSLSFVVKSFLISLKSFFPIDISERISKNWNFDNLEKEKKEERMIEIEKSITTNKSQDLEREIQKDIVPSVDLNDLINFYQNSLKYYYVNQLEMKEKKYPIINHGKLLLKDHLPLFYKIFDFLETRQFDEKTLEREIQILKQQSFFSMEWLGENFSQKIKQSILTMMLQGRKLFSHNIFNQKEYEWHFLDTSFLDKKSTNKITLFGQFTAYDSHIIHKTFNFKFIKGMPKELDFALKDYFKAWFYHLFTPEKYTSVLLDNGYKLTFKSISQTEKENLIAIYLNEFLYPEKPLFLPPKITKEYIATSFKNKKVNMDSFIQKHWNSDFFQKTYDDEAPYEREKNKVFVKDLFDEFSQQEYVENLEKIIHPMIENIELTVL